MLRETGSVSRSGHRMPLVANATRVENQWKLFTRGPGRRARWSCNKPRSTVGMEETTVLEEALGTPVSAPRHGPLHRLEPVVLLRLQPGETSNVEPAPDALFQRGQARVP